MTTNHSAHGRDPGDDYSCPCLHSKDQWECAKTGCEYCWKHCDDYIGDFNAPDCLRWFLFVNRLPASERILFDKRGINPALYADLAGRAVRVTMASCLGDVGITFNLHFETGYERRVPVRALTNFREEP